MMKLKLTALVLGLLTLTGCDGMDAKQFENEGPRLILEDYFQGITNASGIFVDRFGTLRRQFTVKIDGTWDGKELILDEDFSYSDGEKERRIWRITKLDDNTYQGRADDVIGVATGKTFGNALNWRYDLDLKVGESSYKVHFNDWMFLQADGVLLNKAVISKWGITIGTVFISFSRAQAGAATLEEPNFVPRVVAKAG